MKGGWRVITRELGRERGQAKLRQGMKRPQASLCYARDSPRGAGFEEEEVGQTPIHAGVLLLGTQYRGPRKQLPA